VTWRPWTPRRKGYCQTEGRIFLGTVLFLSGRERSSPLPFEASFTAYLNLRLKDGYRFVFVLKSSILLLHCTRCVVALLSIASLCGIASMVSFVASQVPRTSDVVWSRHYNIVWRLQLWDCLISGSSAHHRAFCYYLLFDVTFLFKYIHLLLLIHLCLLLLLPPLLPSLLFAYKRIPPLYIILSKVRLGIFTVYFEVQENLSGASIRAWRPFLT